MTKTSYITKKGLFTVEQDNPSLFFVVNEIYLTHDGKEQVDLVGLYRTIKDVEKEIGFN